MNMPQFTTTEIIVAVVVIVTLIVVALVINAYNRRRTRQLREQFGPEYDRTVALAGGHTAAENCLAERSERVHKLNVRPSTTLSAIAISESGAAFRLTLSMRRPEPLWKRISSSAT